MLIFGRLSRIIIVIGVISTAVLTERARADAIDDEVRAAYSTTTTTICFEQEALMPEMWEFTFRENYPGAPEETIRIYRFFCNSGAYNVSHVYFSYTELYGVQPVAFAIPAYDVECVGPETLDCDVAGVTLTGMTTQIGLVNSTFDPDTLELTALSCWRGLCDASERGLWILEHGVFVLKSFDVDASYNEREDPIRVVDYAPAAAEPPGKR
ncbi:MAG: hypothetical protein AB7U48_11480 [Bauldia sp.]